MSTFLTVEMKIVMLAGAAGVVLVTILLVICFFLPNCALHGCISGRDKNADPEQTAIKLEDLHYYSQPTNTLSAPDGKSHWSSRRDRFRRNQPWYHSTMSTDSGRDSMNSSMARTPSEPDSPKSSRRESVSSNNGDAPLPYIRIALQYMQSSADSQGKLLLHLKEAGELPPRSYVGTCEPFLSVCVEKQWRTLRGQKTQELTSIETEPKKNTQHPVFDQTITVPLSKADIKECRILLTVKDNDKLGGITELGTTAIPLKDTITTLMTGDKIYVARYLVERQQELGDVLVGLMCLPTSQRLSVTVARVAKLPKAPENSNFYVRVMLLNGTGKVLKRKKTAIQPYSSSITFNENISLDLPISQIATAVLLIVVCQDLVSSNSSGCNRKDPAGEDDSQPKCKPLKYRSLGKVALGKQVRGYSQQIHWNSMIQCPRKVISQWHSLS